MAFSPDRQKGKLNLHCDRTPARTLNFLSNGQVSTNSRKCSETYVSELVLEGLGEGFQKPSFRDLAGFPGWAPNSDPDVYI